MFITILRNIATTKSIMVRISALLRSIFKESLRFQHDSLDIKFLNQVYSSLSYGALRFLYHWVNSFGPFISEIDLISVQQLLTNILSNCKRDYSLILPSSIKPYQRELLHEIEKVLSVVKKVTLDRQMNSMGISSLRSPFKSDVRVHNRLNALQGLIGNNVISKITNANVFHTVGVSSERIPAKDARLSKQGAPNIPALASNDAPVDKSSEIVQLKQSVQKISVDIFGVNSLLDNSDDDDDDNDGTKDNIESKETIKSSQNEEKDAATVESPAEHLLRVLLVDLRRQPTPVVADGLSLLINPFSGKSSDGCYFNLLVKIDPAEIARQWTLEDHALFCTIPIFALAHKPTYTLPRYKQQMMDTLSWGLPEYGGLRQVILPANLKAIHLISFHFF